MEMRNVALAIKHCSYWDIILDFVKYVKWNVIFIFSASILFLVNILVNLFCIFVKFLLF